MFVLRKLLVMLLFSRLGARNGPTRTRTPKKYSVNLDLPAEQRWIKVVKDHAENIRETILVFRAFVPAELFPFLEMLGSDVEKYIPAQYANEIKGIAKAVKVNIGDIVLSNLMYDVTTFCTSIVSQDAKGQIWHSRNLDFPVFHTLKKLTISVDFKQSGKTVYSAVTFAGYIGILTGQKPYGFTISVDRRGEGDALWNLLIGLLDNSVVPVSFLVRDALANSGNYTEATDLLANTATAAPVYFIIAGVKSAEAAVITKDRLKPHDIWTIDPSSGRWFEVETNYDHWKNPPHTDNRRGPAIRAMRAVGQNKISTKTLLSVMSTTPVLNHHTIYTVVMSAAKPKIFQGWIRE